MASAIVGGSQPLLGGWWVSGFVLGLPGHKSSGEKCSGPVLSVLYLPGGVVRSDTENQITAVQQLFVRHQSKVRSVALALTADFAAAEDVVQETFLTVTAKACDFDLDTNFLAWACAIARLKVPLPCCMRTLPRNGSCRCSTASTSFRRNHGTWCGCGIFPNTGLARSRRCWADRWRASTRLS